MSVYAEVRLARKKEKEKIRKEIRDSWRRTSVVAGTIEKTRTIGEWAVAGRRLEN
jgi:hypothetical protein